MYAKFYEFNYVEDFFNNKKMCRLNIFKNYTPKNSLL